MSQSLTLEDIYKLFEKTNEQLQESRQQLQESRQEYDRRSADADKRQAEADKRQAEADRREAEADRRAAKADEREAEADRRAAEADKRLAKLEKAVANTTKAVAGLTTRWGRFVEELVEPAVIQLFRERGIDVKETFSRARVTRQGLAMEIDILVVNETELVAIECKSRLSKDDVEEFLEKLGQFKQAFPHYKNFKVYGAVAGIEVDEGIDKYAYKKGLFVIKPSGNTVRIVNNDEFQGKSW